MLHRAGRLSFSFEIRRDTCSARTERRAKARSLLESTRGAGREGKGGREGSSSRAHSYRRTRAHPPSLPSFSFVSTRHPRTRTRQRSVWYCRAGSGSADGGEICTSNSNPPSPFFLSFEPENRPTHRCLSHLPSSSRPFSFSLTSFLFRVWAWVLGRQGVLESSTPETSPSTVDG